MTFIQALYGSGGWPLSVFLSPNLKPMMGGTYFPPDDKYNRAGFKTVLRLEQFNRLNYFFFFCCSGKRILYISRVNTSIQLLFLRKRFNLNWVNFSER